MESHALLNFTNGLNSSSLKPFALTIEIPLHCDVYAQAQASVRHGIRADLPRILRKPCWRQHAPDRTSKHFTLLSVQIEEGLRSCATSNLFSACLAREVHEDPKWLSLRQ